AGLGIAVDHATRHTEIGSFGAGAAIAVPVAIYLLGLWALHVRLRETSPTGAGLTPIFAFLVLLTPWTGQAVPLTGLLVSGLLAVKLVKRDRETARAGSRPRSV
ncbi:MAG: low temperature requirement protein A, partial [Gammaproteobacteria bacterium]